MNVDGWIDGGKGREHVSRHHNTTIVQVTAATRYRMYRWAR